MQIKNQLFVKKKIYGGLKFFVEVKKGIFPLASAKTFFPKLLGGVVIQPADPNRPANFPIILSILPDQCQRTIIIFACFEHDENGKLYLETLEKIRSQSISSLDRIISKIILQETDNTFFSPQYWEKLSDSEKNEFQKQLNESEYYNLLSYKPLQSGINLFDERFLLKV